MSEPEYIKLIPAFPDYGISKTGVLYRLATQTVRKAFPDKFGYMKVRMTKPVGKTVKIHQLVAEAFIGPRPPGREVNHKDGNKANNHLENLEYVTRSQNMKHACATGLSKRPIKPRKITAEQVEEMLKLYTLFSQKQLADIFGVEKQTIIWWAKKAGLPRKKRVDHIV